MLHGDGHAAPGGHRGHQLLLLVRLPATHQQRGRAAHVCSSITIHKGQQAIMNKTNR